jgi:hypothetical protein
MCDGKSNAVALGARSGKSAPSDPVPVRHGSGLSPVAGSASTIAVDGWFNEELCRLYAEMLDEPLPDELVNLLEQIRRGKKSAPRELI